MAKNQGSSNNHIMLGILAGTVVGAIAAAVVGTKKGRGFREDLTDAYHNAGKKISNAANTFSERTHDLSDRYLSRNHRSPNRTNLAIGAIAGGILGISTIVFLTSDSARGIRKQMVHSFETMTNKRQSFEDMAHSAVESFGENISPWMHKIETVINTLNEIGKPSKRHAESSSQPLDKILDWASVAAQLFHSLKK
jgi:gas vesicle protein